MNLTKLFEMQRELDERIVKEKGLEGQDLLPQKILALQVELGECANEWRGFKFWSKNQQPNVKVFTGKHYKHEPIYSNPLLEEYIDCLHFILSIGLHLELDIKKIEQVYSICEEDSITDVFRVTFMCTTDPIDDDQYWFNRLWTAFTYLGEELGFTWDQIEEAYMSKNSENHRRQDNGY